MERESFLRLVLLSPRGLMFLPSQQPLNFEVLESDYGTLCIPRRFFLYGIAYSTLAIAIYVFYPRYEFNEKTEKLEWGFCCYEHHYLDRIFCPWIGLTRMKLINALLTVQRHNLELIELFKDKDHPGWLDTGVWTRVPCVSFLTGLIVTDTRNTDRHRFEPFHAFATYQYAMEVALASRRYRGGTG